MEEVGYRRHFSVMKANGVLAPLCQAEHWRLLTTTFGGITCPTCRRIAQQVAAAVAAEVAALRRLPDRRTYFVSGHLDLTPHEFAEHYVHRLSAALTQNAVFVVGDAPGCDAMSQEWLAARGADVRVFHMHGLPRNVAGNPLEIRGGFASDEERDAAMTDASDADIAWVRPGREASGTAANVARRTARVARGNRA